MATFLRSYNGDYVNVDRITYVVASRAAEAYYVRFKDDTGELNGCYIPEDIWLGYLGVPEAEQDARFEEDMGLAEVHE